MHPTKMLPSYEGIKTKETSSGDGTDNYRSTAAGETARMTANAATINAAATKAVSATLPRLAGNFPRTIQYWLSK